MIRNLIINKPAIVQVEAKKKYSLNLNVRRFTTDANGTVLDDAAIPDALKIPYPFHLFSEYDRNGGYAIADRIVSRVSRTILFAVYTWGLNTPLFFFNALATISNYMQKGDEIFVYVDDLNNPSYFTYVIIHTPQGAYGSLVSQLNTTQLSGSPEKWGTFKIFDIQYGWSEADVRDIQLDQQIYTIQTQFDSSFESNNFSPVAYYHPEYKPNVKKLTIPYNQIANQFFGLSTFIAYENPLLTLSFTIYA
jgi:hypothetical protein